ncbi:hypothetical protein F66182_2069 [Fusarium sp. NRRL 66182]|nr:hypothetical protein F66182_2069 [Fusarium sp. NRRL 66182]
MLPGAFGAGSPGIHSRLAPAAGVSCRMTTKLSQCKIGNDSITSLHREVPSPTVQFKSKTDDDDILNSFKRSYYRHVHHGGMYPNPLTPSLKLCPLWPGTSKDSPLSQLLNLLTLGLWGKVGRLTHYAFDAVLLSAFLAGMKRSTGLSFKTDRVAGENKDLNRWIDKYLGVGEWVMDQSVAIAGSSGFFERTR